ncbi:MAG: hypothetical protein K6F37_07845 [Lachnospiraceae bacterium]|nr:hypothetical protein [Lachnospiraceae bacterium]
MKGYRVIWLDENEEFSLKLTLYANRYFKGRIELISMRELPEDKTISGADMIAVTPGLLSQRIMDFGAFVIIHEGILPEKYVESRKIFRYQAADKIIMQLLALKDKEEVTSVPVGSFNTKMIGVGGFESKRLNTETTLIMADVLAEKEPTLFIDISQCSGVEYLLCKSENMHESDNCGLHVGEDLSELLYAEFAELGYKEKEYKLSLITQKDLRFDYIKPVGNPEHLVECKGERIANILNFIKDTGRYGFVVVLTGAVMEEFEKVLGCMNEYYIVRTQESIPFAEVSFRKYICCFKDEEQIHVEELELGKNENSECNSDDGLDKILFSSARGRVADKLRDIAGEE